MAFGTDPAGLGLGVGTDIVVTAESELDELGLSLADEVDLIRSAAILTLAGTLLSRMTPPPDVADVVDISLASE